MLYKFKIELSDIDRNLYETLDFRISLHPSESVIYLITRALAYALSYEDRLEFSPHGLSDPDAPALQLLDLQGSPDLWIEIGNPAPRKLHKASKLAQRVVVYTHKDPSVLVDDIKKNSVHKAERIEIYSLNHYFLESLESSLEKSNQWSLMVQDQQLHLSTPEFTLTSELIKWKTI